MNTIRLTHGAGDGKNSACLMTASNMVQGKGEFRDKSDVVCQVMRQFIIATNDTIPEDILGDVYGPLVWEIIGTASDDIGVMRSRAIEFLDWADSFELPKGYVALKSLKTERLKTDIVRRDISWCVMSAGEAARRAQNILKARVRKGREKEYRLRVAQECRDILRKVAAIGDRRPVETVVTQEELAAALCRL